MDTGADPYVVTRIVSEGLVNRKEELSEKDPDGLGRAKQWG